MFLDILAEPGGEAELRVENGFAMPAAFDIQLRRREIAPDGSELGTVPAADDFVVYPSQFLVAPTASQVIRLRWLGTEPPLETRAYYVVVEQLPLTLAEDPAAGGGEVRMLVSVLIHLYLNPPAATGEILINAASADANRGQVSIDVSNRGSRHVLLRQGSMEVICRAADGSAIRTEQFFGEELAAILSSTLVPAGGRRTLSLPFAASGDCQSMEARYLPDVSP